MEGVLAGSDGWGRVVKHAVSQDMYCTKPLRGREFAVGPDDQTDRTLWAASSVSVRTMVDSPIYFSQLRSNDMTGVAAHVADAQ
jgi:hypothetical protein